MIAWRIKENGADDYDFDRAFKEYSWRRQKEEEERIRKEKEKEEKAKAEKAKAQEVAAAQSLWWGSSSADEATITKRLAKRLAEEAFTCVSIPVV
jgi:hypothetical protein